MWIGRPLRQSYHTSWMLWRRIYVDGALPKSEIRFLASFLFASFLWGSFFRPFLLGCVILEPWDLLMQAWTSPVVCIESSLILEKEAYIANVRITIVIIWTFFPGDLGPRGGCIYSPCDITLIV